MLYFICSCSPATALVFANHTSTAYQIFFQYPSDWEVTEKTNRFQEGPDISVSKVIPSDFGLITIGYINNTLNGVDPDPVTSKIYAFYREMIGDYTKEIRTIEDPSFVTMDGEKAGTFVISRKDKYDDDAVLLGIQVWLVYSGYNEYLISFASKASMFDSPEKVETRDNFIKSIKFLGNSSVPTSNADLGRFAQ